MDKYIRHVIPLSQERIDVLSAINGALEAYKVTGFPEYIAKAQNLLDELKYESL